MSTCRSDRRDTTDVNNVRIESRALYRAKQPSNYGVRITSGGFDPKIRKNRSKSNGKMIRGVVTVIAYYRRLDVASCFYSFLSPVLAV